MAKSIFSGMKDAKMRVDANYVAPGHYYFHINKCKTAENRKGDAFAAVEMTAVHVLDDDNGAGHKAGEDVTWLIMVKNDFFASDILTFICNILGEDPNELSEDDRISAAEQVFATDDDKDHGQPLAGTVVEVKGRNVKLKDSGKDFTKVSFVRSVPASELLERIDDKIKDRYFPNDVLEKLAADEG